MMHLFFLVVCQNWLKNWNETQLNIQCDSGISSGSDGEFNSIADREKRLNTLKQLARKLEDLSPGSAAIYQINTRLDRAHQDLIVLQSQLSNLTPRPAKTTKEISIQTDSPRPKRASLTTKRPYWLRVFRLAVPLQIAMIVLLLAACVLEPSCCNTLNTFGSSFLPVLKYQGGPPPIWTGFHCPMTILSKPPSRPVCCLKFIQLLLSVLTLIAKKYFHSKNSVFKVSGTCKSNGDPLCILFGYSITMLFLRLKK